jgi:hypothetical protein
MKQLILVFICIAFITSCNTYSVVIEHNSNTFGTACSHPTYLGTMGKSAKFTSEIKNSTSSTFVPITNDQESISLYNLLNDARAKYGNEVTIQNLRWDMKNKKRISVVYDVIKCN